jgi:hypothetical protein
MLRFTLLAILTCSAWAQGNNPFNRPPAEVDEALRARVSDFFKYHVTGEYRKAEALVAEDTKDYFYDHNKPKYLSFEIGKIEYSANFTRAKAVVLCETRLNAPGFGNRVFKVPVPSAWKLEDGKWYWWVEPENINLTPFGKMTPGPEPKSGAAAPGPPSVANMPTSPDFLFEQVRLDKKALALAPESSDVITIHNTAPGVMEVLILQRPGGVEAKLSKSSLNSGEKATLTVTAGKEMQPGELRLQVDPIGMTVVVPITRK